MSTAVTPSVPGSPATRFPPLASPSCDLLLLVWSASLSQGLHTLLPHVPGLSAVRVASSFEEACALVEARAPDAALLEGSDLLASQLSTWSRLPGAPPLVILAQTSQWTPEAFLYGVLDYLVWPFSLARLQVSLTRCRRELHRRRLEARPLLASNRSPSPIYPERLALRTRSELFFVAVGAIDWIEADGDHVVFHCGAQHHRSRQSLRSLSHKLDPRRFARAHRKALLNLERVEKISLLFAGSYSAVLRDGTTIAVSRRAFETLKARLQRSVGKGE